VHAAAEKKLLPPTAAPHISSPTFLFPDPGEWMLTDDDRSPARYWRRNLRYLAVLLGVWFAVSYGAGILFARQLNEVRIPGTGFPLGFWFAQQGSIYVFVLLIFVYVALMNRLDREFDVDEERAP
jgi:putative solute:sodium symporter small subunit